MFNVDRFLFAGGALVFGVCTLGAQTTEPTSLEAAIRAVNREARAHTRGRREAPITVKEVLDRVRDQIAARKPTGGDRALLRQIETAQQLPPRASFRIVTRFDDGEKLNEVWWVRIVLEREGGGVQTVPIRQKTLYSRPYTQLERAFKKRWGERMPVLNRLSAYFGDEPGFGAETKIDEAAARELVGAVRSAVASGDLGALVALHRWGRATKELQTFAVSEMRELIETKIASLRVVPRRHRGDLEHFQAFKTFETTLPHVGYLEVSVAPTAGSDRGRSLFFEIGAEEGTLRLLSYTEHSSERVRELAPVATESHLEPLDGGFYNVWSTTRPRRTPLLSARLAHEEVRRIAVKN